MRFRVVAVEAPAAVEEHDVVGLAYDVQASEFTIPGGALRVRLMGAPRPTNIAIDSVGMTIWFHSTVDANRFSNTLREVRSAASGLDISMLD